MYEQLEEGIQSSSDFVHLDYGRNSVQPKTSFLFIENQCETVSHTPRLRIPLKGTK
jgi:hypothetical protein